MTKPKPKPKAIRDLEELEKRWWDAQFVFPPIVHVPCGEIMDHPPGTYDVQVYDSVTAFSADHRYGGLYQQTRVYIGMVGDKKLIKFLKGE